MKKNLGITDRIIRFVMFDLLLGFSYMGVETHQMWLNTSYVVSLYLLITLIIGYSPIYHIFGFSSREETESRPGCQVSS